MIKVAITGNIASGKSTVQNILKSKGYSVIDADDLSHELLDSEKQIKDFLKNYDVFENGKISRDKLGKLVFANKDLLKKLEEIIHPLIKKQIDEFFENHKSEKYIFVSVPLLYETNMQNIFDKVLFIYADDNIRLKRLIERNGYSEQYALTRMNSQLPQNEKIKLADYIITNNADITNLQDQINKIIQE